MPAFLKRLCLAVLFSASLTQGAMASGVMTDEEALALVKPFYDLFNNKATVEDARTVFHPDWVSHYSNDGFKTLDQTMGFVGGALRQMIPDLTWEIKSVSVTTKNEIVVRGEGSGTPAGDTFFGAPVTGKSFKVMSIDIHTVEDGKVVRTYHIEDWFRGLQQMSGK